MPKNTGPFPAANSRHAWLHLPRQFLLRYFFLTLSWKGVIKGRKAKKFAGIFGRYSFYPGWGGTDITHSLISPENFVKMASTG
jgi:hypothetical protein